MENKSLFQGVAVVVLLTTVSVVAACASGNRGGGPGGGQQGPPPEAIEACAGKQEGDSVSFTGRQGEALAATCQLIDDQLVAVPKNHRRK